MKKIYVGIIVATIVLICCTVFQNYNLVELAIEQNGTIQVVFYIIVAVVIAILTASYVKKHIEQNMYKSTVKKMKTTEEFEVIYKEIKLKLENEFKEIKKKLLLSSILLFVLAAIFAIMVMSFKNPFLMGEEGNAFSIINSTILTILGIGTIILVIYVLKCLKKYNNTYKYEVIGGFVKYMNSNLEYGSKNSEVEKIIKKHYINSKFEKERVDVFFAEDFIIGNLNKDTYIAIADIHVEKEENIEKNEPLRILFNGLFATTTINKNINTTIRILNNEIKIVADDDFVKLDSQEMEKNFDVYATNKMLVMRLFTPEIMEMINKFYNQYKIRFEIIVNNNLVYFRFHTGNMFETRLIEDPFKQERLFMYYTTLKLLLDLTEKFNENLNNLDI